MVINIFYENYIFLPFVCDLELKSGNKMAKNGKKCQKIVKFWTLTPVNPEKKVILDIILIIVLI